MQTLSYEELAEGEKKLLEAAEGALSNSYNPYRSQFKVGAAVETKEGEIFKGSSFAADSSLANLCAERVAVGNANSAGKREIVKLALFGYSLDENKGGALTPCGLCRQFLAEIPKITGTDLEIISTSGNKEKIIKTTLSELFPLPYA